MLRRCQGMLLEGEATSALESQKVTSTQYVLITRTSIMYGGLGRMYGTYRGFGCSLRNCRERRMSQESEVKVKKYNIPTPNDPSLLHSLLSAEDVSFSAPSHRAIGVERQARGPEYAGHQRLVLAGVADADSVSIQGSWLS